MRLPAFVLALVLAVTAAFVPPVQAAEPAVPPVATAEPGEAAPGTAVQVRGTGWPSGGTVQIQICGQNAVHGSADCDAMSAVTTPVAPTGVIEAGLTVAAPPTACPCVIRIATPAGAVPALTDIAFVVLGHKVGAVLKDVTPVRADVVDAELVGGGDAGELFGWRARRTLVLTVRNNGADPIVNPPLVVGWGAGRTADSPITAPKPGTIKPGKTATFRIPVELPPGSFGRFVVGGRFAGSVTFMTAFSTYPYGLLGINLFALLVLVLGVRLALHRRAARRILAERGPTTRGAISAAGLPPVYHQVAPRSTTAVDTTELLGYLDTTAHDGSGAYVVDREQLVSYLNENADGGKAAVDLDAFDRLRALSERAPSQAARQQPSPAPDQAPEHVSQRPADDSAARPEKGEPR